MPSGKARLFSQGANVQKLIYNFLFFIENTRRRRVFSKPGGPWSPLCPPPPPRVVSMPIAKTKKNHYGFLSTRSTKPFLNLWSLLPLSSLLLQLFEQFFKPPMVLVHASEIRSQARSLRDDSGGSGTTMVGKTSMVFAQVA